MIWLLARALALAAYGGGTAASSALFVWARTPTGLWGLGGLSLTPSGELFRLAVTVAPAVFGSALGAIALTLHTRKLRLRHLALSAGSCWVLLLLSLHVALTAQGCSLSCL